MAENRDGYGPMILRIVLGLLFIIPGIMKLMNPAGPTGMLTGLGFPAPAFFAWVLLLSEIIFGISILIGWKVKYTVWPLVLIMVIATITVVIPNMGGQVGNLMWHILAIAGLVSLFFTGPGAIAVGKD